MLQGKCKIWKRNTYFFFIFNKFENYFTLVNSIMYIGRKGSTLHYWCICLQKDSHKGKVRLKIEYFSSVLLNPVFARTLTTSGFRCRIISVNLLVFRVNILLDTNTKILMVTKLKNQDFIGILHIILYQHQWQSSTFFFFFQFLACICKILT